MPVEEILLVPVGVVYNSSGKILFSLRHDEQILEANQKWELPGGRLKFGETATECLMREVREETGYIVEPQKMVDLVWSNIWDIPKENKKLQALLLPFLCRAVSGPYDHQDKKVAKTKWFTLAEIKSLNALPGQKEIAQAALKLLKRRPTYADASAGKKSHDGL